MSTWEAKPGPSLTTGRLCHFLAGSLSVVMAGHLGGYNACAWGVVSILVLGVSWELGTPYLSRRLGWAWSKPDLLDLLAFLAGAIAGAGGYLALR